MATQPDTTTVIAARAGDAGAIDRLVAGYLPLVYTIVGRALDGHADVDDVVQDTMLRVLRNLGDLRDPEAFRSWLVAITVRQVRERYRARRSAPDALLPDDVRDPGADFTDLAITRLELAGQRRETAEATRWMDEDNRELLSLWWLEASGELTRDEIVDAIEVTRQHAAVRIQRMKAQLETARAVVRALEHTPPCPELALVTAGWDGRPGTLWRKRIARHTRECRECSPAWSGLMPAEKLLVGTALVPLPHTLSNGLPALGGLGAQTTAPPAGAGAHAAGAGAHTAGAGAHTAGAGAHTAGAHAATGGGKALATKIAIKATAGIGRRVATAVLATGVVAGGGAAVVAYNQPDKPVTAAAIAAAPAPVPSLTPAAVPSVSPSASPSASPSRKPEPSPSKSSAKPAPKPVPPAVTSGKKGVGTWEFDGIKGALTDVGASWYYNWGPDNAAMPGPAGVEFVPMIWGRDAVTDATLAKAKREGDGTLLGFNEPDLAEQSNMSVEAALDAWPRLQATGMRLGSPAVAYGGDTAGGWLDRFMAGAKERGLRVDFVVLHWYGSDFSAAAVKQFLGYVDAVHERYDLPIWVTEYGLINFSGSPKYPSDAQKVTFIEGTTEGLESRKFVERYAWFGLPAVADSVDFGLYRDARTPTAAGKAYKAAG